MDALIRQVAVAGVLVAGVLMGSDAPRAQEISAADLTAAYLVSFVRFTTWPADALGPGVPIVICVSGNNWVADALVELTRRQAIEGRVLSVRRTGDAGEGCHVYYGSNLNGARADLLIHTTSRLPILTVSDATNFAERGGIVNFLIEHGKLRFAINPQAAERARLQISSLLLSRARIVGS